MKSNSDNNASTATGTRPGVTRQPTAEERRRAQRVLLRMRVLLHVPNNPEPVKAETHTVSQTGAMLLVSEGFPAGTKLTIEHPQTKNRVEVRIVRAAQLSQGGSLQPIEFLAPAPHFWGVFFPPNLN
ncbi:MAG TPA: PilZ domain-containing protein [Candidatus Eremiobacteraceae bacterium]|nr:PilZ domain-containing protein [Candidatus Eremiobacteraceae bacterium]